MEIRTLQLSEALDHIGKRLGLSHADLLGYASEDSIGGFHTDAAQRNWYVGSLWAVEGQFLYTLIRALKPDTVIEIGAFRGCSSTHILSALEANKNGVLISIDVDEFAGSEIPANLRKRWQFIHGPAQEVLRQQRLTAQLVFEDGPHDDLTADILSAALTTQPKLVLSHDGAHFLLGDMVRKAHQKVFGSCETILIPPADCGFTFQVC